MSLSVNLKYLDGTIHGGEKYAKLKFRDVEFKTSKMKGSANIYFGQRFFWPIARKVEKSDYLIIRCYATNRYGPQKFLGLLNIGIATLMRESLMSVRENLVDERQRISENVLTFDIEYFSPSTGNEGFSSQAFRYPVYNLKTLKRTETRVQLPSENSSDDDSFFDVGDADGDVQFIRDDASDVSLLPERDHRLPRNIDPLLLRIDEFQISITVVEAQKLYGFNINPMLEIICANQRKCTEIKLQTNSPFYNEFFTFDLSMSRLEMMEQIIRIRAISKSDNIFLQKIFNGKILGEFSIDAKTVYTNQDHAFYRKWAVLIDPKSPTSGEKGFVKIDISVLGAGDKPKRPEVEDMEENPNIEGNLLLPRCVSNVSRKMCEMSVLVYQAEDLPCMDTSIMSNIKHAIYGDEKPLTDSYVEVSFGGYTARTKVVSRSYSPDWNQQVIFTEYFPPFVTRVRIAVRDSDMIKDETISTVFLDLHKIMYIGEKDDDGFLPTYGPSWINLYGTPRTYTYSQLVKGDRGQNQNLAEGVAYRGRLMIAIKTVHQPESSKIGVEVRPCNPVSNNVAGKREMYLLFGAVYETTLITEEIGKVSKPITFEMSIGTTGNAMDDYSKSLLEKDTTTENEYVHSSLQPRFAYTKDNKYFHIPYGSKKPCFYMITQTEDHRPRMFIPNILEKLKFEMSEHIRQTSYILASHKAAKARKYLRKSITNFLSNIDKVIIAVKSCRGTAKKTILDIKYQKLIRFDLEKIKEKLKMMNEKLSRINIKEKLKECNLLVKILEDKMLDPQFGLPDIFIYMVQEEIRVGYARIKARDILHSSMPIEKGKMSATLTSVYMKKMDNSILPDKTSYNIQAQIQIYLWLGMLKDMRSYKMGLPDGYRRESFIGKMPPKFLEYTDESLFQLRVYLFMARNVIGSDDTGLSDPFVKIILSEHVCQSTVFKETRSPIWDETMIINNIIFHYNPDYIKSAPPNIILEVFDWDSDTDEEFLGRVFCQPNVFIKGDVYTPPKLQWWSIYRGTLAAGDVLAAFDLLELNLTTKKVIVKTVPTISEIQKMTDEINVNALGENEAQKYRIPYQIRPELNTYRLEILLWGVRQLQRIEVTNLKSNPFVPAPRLGVFPINQPRISIDIAGYRIESDKISDWSIQPNFEDNLVSLDLRLPKNTLFWPPISIHCSNTTIFGIKQIVGNATIINVVDFYERKEIIDDNVDDQTTVAGDTDNMMNLLYAFNDRAEIMNEADGETIDEAADAETIEKPPSKNVPQDVTATVPGMVEKLKPSVSTEELESADWWDRYYATIGDLGNKNKIVEEVDKISESESDVEVTGFQLNDIKVDLKSEEDEEEGIEIIDDNNKKKSKKKKGKKKKKNLLQYFRPNIKKEFEKEEPPDGLQMESQMVIDDSWIERITLYSCELESVKIFGGFDYPFKSFPLYRGKLEEDDEVLESPERFGGVFKGNICIYDINEVDMQEPEDDNSDNIEDYDEEDEEREQKERIKEENEMKKKKNMRLFKSLRDINPVDFLVRVYIIKAINLHPSDLNGKSDPYLYIKLGDTEMRNRENYIPQTLNPIFGQCFEFEVTFPQESFLLIQIYDWDRLTKDDLIGETTIDLENRWLSPHRGSCGIMPSYQNHGYLKWKDYMLPTGIVKSLCIEHDIILPVYDKLSDKVDINGLTFIADTMIEDDDGSQIQSLEPLALEILHHWDVIVPGCKLVPEYIETRPLYLPDKPGIQQGILEMWVDMYPSGSAIPAPIDITPRKAISYELRVTIVQTDKVRLVNENFFTKEKTVDIFLKGWMKSTDIDLQKTDVHYKSLSGQGLFNYRFVFQFDYLKSEDSIVYTQKSIYEIDEAEYKTPCFLNMQVLDSGLIMSDKLIGKLKFKLSKFPKPASHYKLCDPFQHSEFCAKFSLFKNKKVRGYWPFIYNLKEEDPMKDDEERIGGCVLMELELVKAEEAESNPVGLARAEPEPLEAPNRPDGSFLNFLNPCNTIMYFIKYRLKWILIKGLVILLIVLLLGLFIYTTPGNISLAVVNKIFG